jgi:uncharacterized BrkB/YihY/UPF0761 family membrane protein
VLIALVWFYVLALIVLSGAVVNELRRERVLSAETSVPEEPDAATDAAGEPVRARGES